MKFRNKFSPAIFALLVFMGMLWLPGNCKAQQRPSKFIDLLPGGHQRKLKNVTMSYLQKGERRDTVSVVLPVGTVCWYYRVIAVRADSAHPAMKNPTLGVDLSVFSLEDLSKGVDPALLPALPAVSLIDFYIFRDKKNTLEFWKNHKFFAAVVEKKIYSTQNFVKNPLEGRVWLGVQNRKLGNEINIRLEAIAVVMWNDALRLTIKNTCMKAVLAQTQLGLNGGQTEQLCSCYLSKLESLYRPDSLKNVTKEAETGFLNDCLKEITGE